MGRAQHQLQMHRALLAPLSCYLKDTNKTGFYINKSVLQALNGSCGESKKAQFMPQILLHVARSSEHWERADQQILKAQKRLCRNCSSPPGCQNAAQKKSKNRKMPSHCRHREQTKLLGCVPRLLTTEGEQRLLFMPSIVELEVLPLPDGPVNFIETWLSPL